MQLLLEMEGRMICERQRCIITFFLLLPVVLIGCGEQEPLEALPDISLDSNLVVNPAFEEWDRRLPVGWELVHFEGDGTTQSMYGKSTKERVSGKASFYLRGVFNTDKWMALVQRHPVIPGYKVEFSAEIKSSNIKKFGEQKDRANLFIRFLDEQGKRVNDRYYADAYTRERLGTTSWRRSVERADIPKDARFVEIGIVNQMTGYLYVDDVELKIIEPIPWQEVKTKHLYYHYLEGYPPPEGSIDKQAATMESYVEKLDIKVEERYHYYYYPSEERFMKITGMKRYRQVALWRKRELHTTAPTEDHAGTHMLLVDYGYPPLGLTKGIVFYLRGSLEGKDIHATAKEFLIEKEIPALYRTLDTEDFGKYNSSITVPAWTSFCSYLIDRYGPDKIMKLYEETAGVYEVARFNVIFKDIYEELFEDTDRAWRLWLLRLEVPGEGDTLP
jgi:hypothetical protein